MKEFLDSMAEALETSADELTMDLEFRSVEGWSSMMGFSIIIMMEQEYGVHLSIPEFLSMKTVGDLYARIKK